MMQRPDARPTRLSSAPVCPGRLQNHTAVCMLAWQNGGIYPTSQQDPGCSAHHLPVPPSKMHTPSVSAHPPLEELPDMGPSPNIGVIGPPNVRCPFRLASRGSNNEYNMQSFIWSLQKASILQTPTLVVKLSSLHTSCRAAPSLEA